MEQDVIATKRRLAAIAGDLEIPVPFVLSEFVARLEHARGRPIVIHPFPQPEADPVFGLWLAMENADYIYHDTWTEQVPITRRTSSCTKSRT